MNKKEQVVLVTPKNEDGVKVIGDMKLKGSDLRVAVNAIIGSMLREGYISELANSILISVDSDDPIKSAEMQNRLSAESTYQTDMSRRWTDVFTKHKDGMECDLIQ